MSTDKTEQAWQALYRRAINEANGLTNYVEDRPELRSAEKRIARIEEEARALAAAPPAQPQEPVGLTEAFRAAWKQEVGSASNTAGRDVAMRVMLAALAASPPRAVEPLPPLPLKVWTRHDAPDGEWWSNGRWTIVKDSAQKWVLSADRREVSRHEYLSEAQFYARTAITKE